jgi:hypothetical protein
MAAELVVVAADVGGQAELVEPDCGFLVPRGDDRQERAQFVQILARCIGDRALRQRLGARAAQRVAEGFRLDQMGARMLALFELASSRRGGPDAVRLPLRFARETATFAVDYVRLHDLATQLWATREQRLGLHRSWRTSMLGMAYRVALRTPPPVRRELARIYQRLFVRA